MEFSTYEDFFEAFIKEPRSSNIWIWTGGMWTGPSGMRDVEGHFPGKVYVAFSVERPTNPPK